MNGTSIAPELGNFEIPMDVWTTPFWEAAGQGRLVVPRCTGCGLHRWPPGPFCPGCQAQDVEWVPAGRARIYSFTIVPDRSAQAARAARFLVPALVEFPEAGGIRFPAALVDAPLDAIEIGAWLEPDWIEAANARVPVFRLAAA